MNKFIRKTYLTALFISFILPAIPESAFASATINGTIIRNTDSQAIAGIHVYANPVAGGSGYSAETNELGVYSLSLPAGSYRINAGPEIIDGTAYIQKYYNNRSGWGDADAVTVSDGQTLDNVNFSLDVGGVISGIVYKEDGETPIANENISGRSMDGARSAGTRTDSNGEYSLIVPEGDYNVRAGGNTEYAPRWYDGQNYLTDADTVTVSQDETVTDINFTLDIGAILSGTVRDPSGDPVSGVDVVCDNRAASHVYSYSRTGVSGLDGTYLIQGLPQGIAKVTARPAVSSHYAFSNKYIYLDTGEAKSGLDFDLVSGHLVSGYVKDAPGSGIFNAMVRSSTANESIFASARTDANGKYEMVLPSGNYTFFARDSRGDVALPQSRAITGPATIRTFTAYNDSNGATLGGNVYNGDGYDVNSGFLLLAAKAGVLANINSSNYDLYANNNFSQDLSWEGGDFNILSPPKTNYDICLGVYNLAENGTTSFTVRDILYNVPPNSTGNDFSYDTAGGALSGKITYDKAALIMGKIFLRSISTGLLTGIAEIDQNGDYSLYNIPSGDYLLQARDLDGVRSQETAVTINEGEDSTANIRNRTNPPIITADLDGNGQADIVVDFGTEYGTWVYYNDSVWTNITRLGSKWMVKGNIDGNTENKEAIILDCGPEWGIWMFFNRLPWEQLHDKSSKSAAVGDFDANGQDDIVIDFGPEYGIWIYYNNSTWQPLHPVSAKSMVAGDIWGDGYKSDIIIDFGPAYGIWIYHAAEMGWEQLHYVSADSIAVTDLSHDGIDDIVVDFGSPHGIWIYYDGYIWDNLHGISPEAMTATGSGDLIIDFGPLYGVWIYYSHGDNAGQWTSISGNSPSSVAAGNIDDDAEGWDEAIADFGDQYGIWTYYNNSYWTQLHNVSPQD